MGEGDSFGVLGQPIELLRIHDPSRCCDSECGLCCHHIQGLCGNSNVTWVNTESKGQLGKGVT